MVNQHRFSRAIGKTATMEKLSEKGMAAVGHDLAQFSRDYGFREAVGLLLSYSAHGHEKDLGIKQGTFKLIADWILRNKP